MKGNPEKAKSQIKGKILHEYKRDKINSFSKSLTKLNIRKDSNKIYSFILFLIICFSFLSQAFSSKKIELRRLNANNFITLKIQASGLQPIINEGFTPLPSSIQINEGELITENIVVKYELTSDTNSIKMTWDSQLNSCQNMFKGLEKIISIDLTNFDFQLVTCMQSFFEGCINLKSIDLSNVNAPAVTDMMNMFFKCKSLISINFASFKAEKVQDLKFWFGRWSRD